MGRELQKKKRRSKRKPVRPKKPQKVLNPRGNSIIAQNWSVVFAAPLLRSRPFSPSSARFPSVAVLTSRRDRDKKETLSQNYRRLGLVARLRGPAGGSEKKLGAEDEAGGASATKDPLAVAPPAQAVVSEARVERDADGKIVRLLGRRADNPLRDPLADLDEDEEPPEEPSPPGTEATAVVRSLVAASRAAAPARRRQQSEREAEWLARLVARHGRDTAAMARDMKLNPMQQTAADIARRIRKMEPRAPPP